MKYIVPFAIGTSLAVAAPALAQTSGEGLYYSGFVQAEYYNFEGGDESGFYGDATIGYSSGAGTSLDFGVEVSVEALDIDGETLDVWNPIVFFDTGFGRISVGAPKSVVETYALDSRFESTGVTALSYGFLTSSAPKFLALVEEELIFGARYDHRFDQTAFGVSFHRYSEGSLDADMFGAALRHSFANIDLFAAYERVDVDVDDFDSYSVGAEGSLGSVRGGISYTNGSLVSEDVDSTKAYVDYDFNEQISVGAEFIRFSVPGDDFNLYSVNADYTFWQNAYVGLSYIDGSDSFEPVYSARLGWKF